MQCALISSTSYLMKITDELVVTLWFYTVGKGGNLISPSCDRKCKAY